ncbi:TIGR02444 family protein [Parashewanella tropica]|uniref:TIGR02444 family protein n=1 Tax=Parashewanella tropica TaxID=2547970 RepID=UPI00105A8770|nr:TIGR02444 family protein [Parashewanella tropica]
MVWKHDEVWSWCDQFYFQQQSVCLKLQDSVGLNVNLLLLAQYLDTNTGLCLSPQQFQILIDSISSWENKIVSPYRKLRKLAKSMVNEAEYHKMLDLELTMERKTQKLLSHAFSNLETNATGSNLSNFLSIYSLSASDISWN